MRTSSTQPEWPQPTLIAPDVLELTVKIGVVNSAQHCQYAFELRSATDGVLLALEARPHGQPDSIEQHAVEILSKALNALQPYVLPF